MLKCVILLKVLTNKLCFFSWRAINVSCRLKVTKNPFEQKQKQKQIAFLQAKKQQNTNLSKNHIEIR
jgi:hypothetical protein